MSEPGKQPKTYRGGCHCGQVAFEATGVIEEILECNCSMCAKKGYLHWIIPRDSFRLLTHENKLATYRFNTGVARHHFCPTCGIASFYVPRSDPDKIDVNVRCLEGVEISQLKLRKFDGQNWEASIEDRDRSPRGQK